MTEPQRAPIPESQVQWQPFILGSLAIFGVALLCKYFVLSKLMDDGIAEIVSKSLGYFGIGYLVVPASRRETVPPPFWSVARLKVGLSVLAVASIFSLLVSGMMQLFNIEA